MIVDPMVLTVLAQWNGKLSWFDVNGSPSDEANIKDLWTKRDELQRQILIEEENKHKFENAIRLSSEKLPKINENLAKNNYAKNRI
ncbi:unnamed protein product [Rotaria sordida]|uniref:Uncharacterized protein n=1 Tax=Rotaria sordida TaxID=392033 RepID=A0A819BGL6_9BILA|nr:unnamed protein product [Rotaria sordida]CAF3800905.1 unnamed protein product [Rotaria sordida]